MRPIGRYDIQRVELHIFFDAMGAKNYLTGLYDDEEIS